MGFFSKIKNKLGIGGVSVGLDIPNSFSKEDETIAGTIILTTKSDQEIVDCKVKLIEERTTGRGDDKKTKEYKLGEIKLPGGFSIKEGETKEVPFELPFVYQGSTAENLKEKGGAMGAIGKMAKFAGNEKSQFFIDADVDVKAAALDPSEKKEIMLS